MSLNQSYAALADPSRRAILRSLVEQGSSSVSELAAPLSIGMPTVMKHLDVLSRAGMIERRKSGRIVTVSLAPNAMSEAMDWLNKTSRFWSARLDRLVDVVEQEQS
jgi:DNA-binding transcriptional ArsR family regulator